MTVLCGWIVRVYIAEILGCDGLLWDEVKEGVKRSYSTRQFIETFKISQFVTKQYAAVEQF